MLTLMPDLPDVFLPRKESGTTSSYTYDATSDVTFSGIVDTIVSATFAASPGGEIVPSMLSVSGALVTVWLTGGVAGRNYVESLFLTTLGGRTVEVLLGQVCDAVLSQTPLTPPANPGFGTAITWTTGASVMAQSFPMIATGLLSAGTNQATAAALPGQSNVATGGISGGGFVLPTIIAGTISFTNAWTSDILIYPPGSAWIMAFGPSAPVFVSPSQTVEFMTSSSGTQWYI